MTKKKILIIAAVIGCISLIFFISGIVFFVTGSKNSQPQSSTQNYCSYSSEAKRIGLDGILQKAQDKYYKLFPDLYYLKPNSVNIRKYYKVTDLSPKKIKENTDSAKELYQELVANLQYDSNKLTQREKKALSQLEFFLKSSFSTLGFDGDYYSGVWMMGPDPFCYKSICYIEHEMYANLHYLKPTTVEEMEHLRDILINLNSTFSQYVENLKLGVEAGMVMPVETCSAAYNALGMKYPNVFRKGAEGEFVLFEFK